MDGFPDAARAAFAQVSYPDEDVEAVAPAVGCTVVMTDRRLLVIRDGAAFRPTSGIASFDVDRDLNVRIGPDRRQVLIATPHGSSTAFIRPEHVAPMNVLIAAVRARTRPG